MSTEQGKDLPGWLVALFIVVLAGGALYAVVVGGLMGGSSKEAMYRESAGIKYEQAVVEVKPERTATAIANGEATYKSVCFACHGMNLEGGVGPMLSDSTWLHTNKESELKRLVTKGISAAETKAGAVPMPAKGGRPDLTDGQVWEVIYYLSSKNSSIEKD